LDSAGISGFGVRGKQARPKHDRQSALLPKFVYVWTRRNESLHSVVSLDQRTTSSEPLRFCEARS
ncbi:unnamed protein product, partial [Ectocarpus sp. 13 AM-2016]